MRNKKCRKWHRIERIKLDSHRERQPAKECNEPNVHVYYDVCLGFFLVKIPDLRLYLLRRHLDVCGILAQAPLNKTQPKNLHFEGSAKPHENVSAKRISKGKKKNKTLTLTKLLLAHLLRKPL